MLLSDHRTLQTEYLSYVRAGRKRKAIMSTLTKDRKDQARDVMESVNGRLLSACDGPNETQLEFWQVGSAVCILQIFPDDGGVTHFIPGNGITWMEMQTQLEEISKQ